MLSAQHAVPAAEEIQEVGPITRGLSEDDLEYAAGWYMTPEPPTEAEDFQTVSLRWLVAAEQDCS